MTKQNDSANLAILTKDPRRPELPPLVEKIQRENPKWSREKCLIAAKQRLTNKPVRQLEA